MPIAYHDIYAALYARAATDVAGTALRALLGGESSLFVADRLGRVTGLVLPWLVWRAGPISGASNEMRDVNASWWVYGEPTKGTYDLHEIAAAVEALYGGNNALAVEWGRIGITHISRPERDESLSLTTIECRFGYLARG